MKEIVNERKIFREFNKENFSRVLTHPFYAQSVNRIKEKAEEQLATEPKFVSFAAMNEYYKNGTRDPYSKIYGDYTSRLSRYFFMYMATEDEKYIMPLADVIWAICNLESWSNVAHVAEDLPIERRRILLDLSSTALAEQLAMVVYYMGEKLPALVLRRLKAQLRERCIESYANNDDYWWMRTTLNWAAVCAGNILSTYLFIAEEEEIEAQLPRLLETLRLYITGFDDEGCCPEGYGYWNYGFIHYCLAASMLRDYTDGKINLFDNPKVHKIALFQQNAAINDTQTIPFSDCASTFKPSISLTHFLKSVYSDIEMPPLKAENVEGIRRLLWINPEYTEEKMNPASMIYHGAQWFIYRSPEYNFACKAGSNNEPHNHNDIGSFVISKNGAVTYTDSGIGTYTKQYFDPPTRYDHVVTSSKGHSVPIINGNYQVLGKEKSVITVERECEYGFNMQNGYNIDTLTTLNRRFLCEKSGVSMTDTYEFSEAPQSVVERFISLIEPTVTDEGVKVGESTLVYDKDIFELSLSTGEAIRTYDTTVYFVDLKVKNPTANFSVSVKFI